MSAVTFVLPEGSGKSQPKTKRMYPFEAFYGNRKIPNDPIIALATKGRGLLDHRTGKFHARGYSDIELASLARWLNDRATGYADSDGMS